MAKKGEIEVVADLKDLITGKMAEIVAQGERMDAKLSNIGGGGKGGMMQSVLGANLLTGAIQRGAGAITDFAKESIIAFGELEQFQTSLTTMFKGNRDEADALIQRLQEFAKTTPFELTEIQDATKMMIAYGSTSGSVVNEMRMLGDISSGVGAPLKDIAYLYGTLRTQGKAYAMDIRQFAGRGIPIIEALAKQFKVSKNEVMDLVSKGKVGFKEVEAALNSLTEKGGQFAGMMEAQSKTLLGSWSNLEDGVGQLKTAIGENFADMAKEVVSSLTTMVNEASSALQKLNKMNSDFRKGGASEFSLFEKASGEEITKYGSLQKILDASKRASQGSESQFHAQKSILNSYLSKITEDYQHSDFTGMTAKDYLRQRAMIKGALSQMDALKSASKKNAELAGGKDGKKEATDLEKVAAANRPSQTNIHIENLVKSLTNVVKSPSEALQLSAEAVAKVFISAVNDISVNQHR